MRQSRDIFTLKLPHFYEPSKLATVPFTDLETMSTELTDNQVRGYKATLHNPRVSDEAKEHAQQVLEGDAAPKRAEDLQGEEHQTHPLGGKKATLTGTYLPFRIAEL